MKIFLIISIIIAINTSLFAKPKGYPPIFSNESNASEYDWNAIDSKWINTRALLMAAFDSTYYKDNETIPNIDHYSKTDVRGVRVGVGGTVNFKKPWLYLISGSINSFAKDFNSSTDDSATLYDALLDIPIHDKYGRMQIGRMKEPISMERLMGMVFEQVMERPMHLDTFTTTRNDGIAYSNLYFNERVSFRSGLFKDKNLDWTSRLSAIAYYNSKQHRLLHLAVSYRYEKIKDNTIDFTVKPEQYFVSPIIDTGDIKASKDDTLNLEFSYLDNSLWIASEYTGKYIHRTDGSNLYFYGFHSSFSYFVSGEKRGYNKKWGIVRRIRPKIDFDEGGLGALELAYRYSYINLNSNDINSGTMYINSIGAIWHATYETQFHLQFTRAVPNLPTQEIKPLDSIQMRFVLVID